MDVDPGGQTLRTGTRNRLGGAAPERLVDVIGVHLVEVDVVVRRRSRAVGLGPIQSGGDVIGGHRVPDKT